MALRTVEQYLQSLRDGRNVYISGEKVEDVTTHPMLRLCAEGCAMEYALAQNPKYKELFVTQTKEGEPVAFTYLPAKNTKELLRYREAFQTLVRASFGRPVSAKMVGVDVLRALTVISRRMDRELKTDYSQRVENYRKYLMQNDLTVAGAVTDAKGDRSLRPSKQVQHKDYYVRVVKNNKDGIIVRGAKMHIGKAPCSNEIFVCPTRNHREEDKDYAVAFAIPANTPGVTIISKAPEVFEEGNYDDYPFNTCYFGAQGTIIFEDVFVPEDRIFLKREWRYSGQIAHMFANFHRLTSDAYKYPELEILAGLAALLAEYNGLERVPHVRDELAWLFSYAEATEALGLLACHHCVIDSEIGVAYPNPMYSNIAKFFHADNYHKAVKFVQDIGGGILSTVPSLKDFFNPQTRALVDKYLGGKAGVPTEHRIRAVAAAKDYLNCFNQAQTIHAEGSLAAQRLSIHAMADVERYKAAARRMAGISDGKEHPMFKDLPPFPPGRYPETLKS